MKLLCFCHPFFKCLLFLKFLGFSKLAGKVCEERVQTRGYLALRTLHADTLTRLLSESAHEAQTFLDKLRKPKRHQRPLTQTKNQFNLKDISFSTKIRITIEKQTRTF